MKTLVLAILLMASAAQAYLVPGNGDGRQRPHRPSPSQPYYPGNPYEPNPYEPGYGYNDYGPARTVRWKDLGETKVDKLNTEIIRLDANRRLVNEIIVRVAGADAEIVRATARLSSGHRISLPAGRIQKGREVRFRLDRYYSVRTDSIEVEATTPGIIGGRARLQFILGLAD